MWSCCGRQWGGAPRNFGDGYQLLWNTAAGRIALIFGVAVAAGIHISENKEERKKSKHI
jgi:hypothetical protein